MIKAVKVKQTDDKKLAADIRDALEAVARAVEAAHGAGLKIEFAGDFAYFYGSKECRTPSITATRNF